MQHFCGKHNIKKSSKIYRNQMLSLLGRDTRQHLYDTILSFLDDERCEQFPVTIGLRVNSLSKGRIGCVYLCIMERNETAKLQTLKRFRFSQKNWHFNRTLTEHHLLTARNFAYECGENVLNSLDKLIELVHSERNPVLTLTYKQTEYFTSRRFDQRKCRYWKWNLQAGNNRILQRMGIVV